ncbi:Probable 6-phosphogluconolactonase 1 [Dionaea muscipula]
MLPLKIQKSRGELRIHENLDELKTALVLHISELSEASVRERGYFTIALSGGSHVGLLAKLTEVPYSKIVDWGKWIVFWTDERMVARSHADSNYRLAKESFLKKVPVISSHIHSPVNELLTAEEAAIQYQFNMRQQVKARMIGVSELCDCPKFDLILLEMGDDGHVASLFPDHPALVLEDDWVTFMTDSPKPPPERITFTFPVINSASNVAVVVTGESRANAAHLAIDDLTPDSVQLPARKVHPKEGKLVWFLDYPAAAKLDGVQLPD